MAEHLEQIMLLQVLRLWLASEKDRPSGWLGALSDPRMAKAIGALHADPARRWRLAELADIDGANRKRWSHTDERFANPCVGFLFRCYSNPCTH
ncbi:hypothetical protein [Ancylobacter sp. G4_0304]|uniref:hypothetical protein n=1 Tax=Ancylobacter sp. G4_0304 TaxID=3114289 RepID=UPI0039C5F306